MYIILKLEKGEQTLKFVDITPLALVFVVMICLLFSNYFCQYSYLYFVYIFSQFSHPFGSVNKVHYNTICPLIPFVFTNMQTYLKE